MGFAVRGKRPICTSVDTQQFTLYPTNPVAGWQIMRAERRGFWRPQRPGAAVRFTRCSSCGGVGRFV